MYIHIPNEISAYQKMYDNGLCKQARKIEASCYSEAKDWVDTTIDTILKVLS